MSEFLQYSRHGAAALIRFNNGKVNAFSPDMLAAINSALDQAEAEQAIVVLTGHEGLFSGGFDLKVMQQGIEAAGNMVDAGSRLTRRMLAFPRPIIAACSGHAIAKGAFLLLASDYRIGVEGSFKIGLNEVAIGMTMHHAGIELCRGRLAPVYYNRAMINGEMFGPQAAVEAGFLDQLVESQDKLLETAFAMAEQMALLNAEAHYQTKLKARKQQLDALDQAIELDKEARSAV